MFVSATPRYEGSSLSPLSKRGARERGQRPDQPGHHHEAPEAQDEGPPLAAEPEAFTDVAFDLVDETLGYSAALAATAADDAGPSLSPAPAAPSAAPDDSLFALLDRVAAKS